ncbi:MAG: lecithin retinol acyltransferase family protein [Candidatus Thiodiazotropha endolucinida]|nr:lecithin retinol acyltransferase family protein [Candidatus Thiodiazotropha endolucinida]
MNYLQPGTIVSVAVGPITHFGIVSDRADFGRPKIISTSKRTGQVAEEKAETFANGGKIKLHGYPSQLPPFVVLRKARNKLGTKYDVFNWNCEHFVRWAHGLKPESPQLRVAIFGVLSLLAFAIIQK